MLLLWLATACTVAPLQSLPAPSAIPLATQTSPPATASIIPTTSATVTPPTPTPSATPDLVATLAMSSEPQPIESAESPDGDWQAEVLRWECAYLQGLEEPGEYAYEQLRLLSAAGAPERIIARQLLNCGGLGAFGLGRLRWSDDSRYLHYTDAREGQPDGGYGGWSPSWLVYDQQLGQVLEARMGPVAPDGDRLIARLDGDLVVWGFREGEQARYSPAVPGAEIGPAVWSLDGEQILYLQWRQEAGSDLILLDLQGGEEQILADALPERFVHAFWDQDRILLWDERGDEWIYRWEAQELVSP